MLLCVSTLVRCLAGLPVLLPLYYIIRFLFIVHFESRPGSVKNVLFFTSSKTGSVVHPTSYTVGTGGKATRA
jgi:hypothetical protein